MLLLLLNFQLRLLPFSLGSGKGRLPVRFFFRFSDGGVLDADGGSGRQDDHFAIAAEIFLSKIFCISDNSVQLNGLYFEQEDEVEIYSGYADIYTLKYPAMFTIKQSSFEYSRSVQENRASFKCMSYKTLRR